MGWMLPLGLGVLTASASSYLGYGIYRTYRNYFCLPKGVPILRADLSDLTGKLLSHYYVHSGGKGAQVVELGLHPTVSLDEDGIPVVNYGSGLGKRYNPVIVSRYALENWELFLQTGEQEYRDIFFRQVNWLVAFQEEGKWYYHFDFKPHFMRSPWISGMSQSLGISVLLRAYQLSESAMYLNVAEKALGTFKTSVDRGGVACKKGTGMWFEEYPNPSAPSHVMNGHIWALFGIWDMYRVTRDPGALDLFNAGVLALKTDLGKYDTGYWVVYSQHGGYLVPSGYMIFQIEQLKVLYAISGEIIFSTYADKWNAYQQRSFYYLTAKGYLRDIGKLFDLLKRYSKLP